MAKQDSFTLDVKTAIADILLNPTAKDANAKPVLFEQYKLVVDASNRTDDRRVNLNNFFITINGIFVPFLINTFPLDKHSQIKLFLLFILTCVGLMVCSEWISIMNLYKKINYINHSTIKAFEEKLPSYAFSIRTDILAKQTDSQKANAILNKEMIIPKLFIAVYVIYFTLSVAAVWFN